MYSVTFLGPILLVIVVLLGTPIGLSFFILWIVKRKGYDKRWKLLAIVPILTVSYFIYTAFYPTESFYKDDFNEVTGVEFPADGQIIYKTASYPDHFGDYESISVVKLSREFYSRLPDSLSTKGLILQPNTFDEFTIDDLLEKFDGLKISKEYSVETEKAGGVVYYVGFLSDNETVIVRRSSW